jgi:hypothetical protein
MSMRRFIATGLAVLALAAPVMAKESGKKGHSKHVYALAMDRVTGACEITEVGLQEDPPIRLRLLGNYETQEYAEAAEAKTPTCKTGTAVKNPALETAESNCSSNANRSESTLLNIFSLRAFGSKEAVYADCMKRLGYDVKP